MTPAPQAVNATRAAALLAVSRDTFYRLLGEPGFPQPWRLPARRRGAPRWWVADLVRWAESRRTS